MNSTERKITFLGIGQAGIRILSELHAMKQSALFNLIAVDTDQETLEKCPLAAEAKLLAGYNWRSGQGCGGNVLAGSRAIAAERPKIEEMIQSSQLLIVLGGLGRGTASGGVGILMSVARKAKIPAIFILTEPFALEGYAKARCADNVLKNELLPIADVVLTLSNDLLFSVLPATSSLEEGFALSDRQMSRTALALGMIFQAGNLLSANFTDFVEVLERKKSFCSIGIGIANTQDVPETRCVTALERLLLSPLLGGVDKISGADALIVSLLGGPDLTLGESRHILEKIAKLAPRNPRMVVSAATSPEMAGQILLSVITVKFDANSEIEQVVQVETQLRQKSPARRGKAAESDGEQLLFALDSNSRGIMEKTEPVIINKEDVDIPTFQRRQIKIDPGH